MYSLRTAVAEFLYGQGTFVTALCLIMLGPAVTSASFNRVEEVGTNETCTLKTIIAGKIFSM